MAGTRPGVKAVPGRPAPARVSGEVDSPLPPLQGPPLRTLSITAVLGILTAAVLSLGLVSTQSPEDLAEAESILSVYGER